MYDSETALVRFGARDYDPQVGRWLSNDPLGFDGGQTNLYVYVGNDPVNYTDPTGRLPWFISGPLCVYYEWRASDDYQECASEYEQSCGADPLSESCSDFCGGDPSYPSDDVWKCVNRKNGDAFQGMLKYCTQFSSGWGNTGAGGIPSGKP
jgi:RHS repeat-associated protein